MKVLESLIIASVESITSKHLEFTFRDLFCLFKLCRIQLDYIVLLLVKTLVFLLIIHVVILSLGLTTTLSSLLILVLLLSAALFLICSILLSNFILHNVD